MLEFGCASDQSAGSKGFEYSYEVGTCIHTPFKDNPPTSQVSTWASSIRHEAAQKD